MALVKLCPTCGAENAPTSTRCSCGSFLIGVDLVEAAGRAAAPSVPEMPAASAEPAASGAPTAAGPVCGHADCAQVNPAGSTVCVYCNRPLAHATAAPVTRAARADSPSDDSAAQPRGPTSRRMLINLPAALASRFEICEPLKAAGAEADLLIVADKAAGERSVLKLYRHGIEPCTDVLERVSRAAPGQLVHLIEHGRDEGVPYELLEYCEHGSLRTLFKGTPLPPAAVHTLLLELADALAHLHDCGIVHRDLKPENVLIRGLLPLDLVLTDFGTASIADATMHYTSAARTLRYSAPEAGSNWVGRPTDYWALGMMLLEALTGRHPFEGLSEAVIAHWLVTKPIDVSAVADPRWQRLCRGLLTRDPKQRWGAEQIRRWLAGDETLTVALEPGQAASGAVDPYRVNDTACRTPRELAVALAAHWSIGLKDLKRGMLRAWLQNDLRDQNLARAAADAEEALEQSDDERLLRLLRKLDPGLPPVFKGYDVSVSGLAALVRAALEAENEARQTVFELLERNLLQLFPVDALHDAIRTFATVRQDFEQAIASALAAGAPRTVAPQGREWQLRMLLLVLEPPPDVVASLRASAHRVGGRAARHCAWYRALGAVDDAGPGRLAAMILLGPSASQAGMEIERERARAALQALCAKIDAHPQLTAAHGAARDHLAGVLERTADESELLAAVEALGRLEAGTEDAVQALFRSEVHAARLVHDPERLREVRRRIGEWAAWRAGEQWRDFADRIDIVAVLDRRSYRVQLGTQFESRRVAYRYTAADLGRMPAAARRTVDDVWACRMPALPEFGADLKLERPREVHCAACGARGRVELQQSWGSMAYPFSTTFACHDKVGVQCQSRMGDAVAYVGVPEAPQFVSEFIAAHATIDPAPERMLAFEVDRVAPAWIEHVEASAGARLREMLANAEADVRDGERISRQRLRVTWTGVTEIEYRFEGRSYRMWIPERVDVNPIAVAHPLPSADGAPAPGAATPQDPRPVREPDAPSQGGADMAAPQASRRRGRPGAAASGTPWLRAVGPWLAILAAVACTLAWIVVSRI